MRVSLGLKQLTEDPWKELETKPNTPIFEDFFLLRLRRHSPRLVSLIRPTLLQLLKIIATIGSKCLALSPFHTGGNLYWLYHWSLSLSSIFSHTQITYHAMG